MNAVWTPFVRAWTFRHIIQALLGRNLSSRFRGSLLGWAWSILSPLVTLTVYTLIFSSAVGRARVDAMGGVRNYALFIFAGLVIFNVFNDVLYSAPLLLHEQRNFIKKTIFPSEILAWTSLLASFVNAAIAFLLLMVFLVWTTHAVPAAVLLMPLLIVPYAMFLLGTGWMLMALGAFTRDVAHIMLAVAPVLMFATPVFYGTASVSPSMRGWMRLNVVGNYIEMTRDLLLSGRVPAIGLYVGTVAFSILAFALGYAVFARYKAILTDVI